MNNARNLSIICILFTFVLVVSTSSSAQVLLQAEDGVLESANVLDQPAGFSGTGYVVMENDGRINLTFTVSETALHQLEFRYTHPTGNRKLDIFDGSSILIASDVNFEATGSNTNWSEVSAFARFEAGVNTINLRADGLAPFIDSVLVSITPPDPNKFLTFPINSSHEVFAGSEDNTNSYYAVIDPTASKNTFEKWLQANDFDQFGADAGDAHATYLNGADLNFGRDMYVKKRSNGDVASYVQNYPSLEDAINGTKLIATVAMEYARPVNEFGSTISGRPRFTKFYVFDADGERVNKADLDGRGEKFVPGLCNVCHGGKPKLGGFHGSVATYQDFGDTNAKWIPWDLDTFEYHPTLTRSAQEGEFKKLSASVLDTNPTSSTTQLVNGWYGGSGMPSATFNGNFVPPGWLSTTDGDKSNLYLQVVAPNCRSCHNQRGSYNNSGHIIFQGQNLQTDLEFATFSRFAEYKDDIERLVYDQALMPLAKQTFENFWRSNAPVVLDNELFDGLAHQNPPSNVYGFVEKLAFGERRRPGRPIARIAGASNGDASGLIGVSHFGFLPDFPTGEVTRLLGRASQFADSFFWSVKDNGTLSSLTVVQPRAGLSTFEPGNTEGVFRLRLAVTNPFARAPGISGFNDIAEAIVFTDDSLEPLNFVDDIYPLLTTRFSNTIGSTGGASCVECHSNNAIRGRPHQIFDLQDLSLPGGTGDPLWVFIANSRLLTRIDCNDPENSLALKKADGQHHYPGRVQGFGHFPALEFFPNEERRELMLRWVMEGARYDSSNDSTFGCLLGTGQIGDFVWEDLNGNGRQDTGEPGLQNVTVNLKVACNSDTVLTTMTNADGEFIFDDLPEGNYQLEFIKPSGFSFSPTIAAGDHTLDSNADPVTGLDACRTLDADQRRHGLDAGLIPSGGPMDTLTVQRAIYYPNDNRVWIKLSSDALTGSAIIIATAVTNGVETVLGQVGWKAGKQAYQQAFKNLAQVPDTIKLVSDQGGMVTAAVRGGGGSSGDTLTINKAIYFTADNKLWIRANSDASPAGSSTITAVMVINSVETVLGQVGWKPNKNAYQQVFKNINMKPDSIILNSKLGGTVMGPVSVR